MNILVTGGAGFIGSNFVRFLIQGEASNEVRKVVVVDDLTYAGNLGNFRSLDVDPRFSFVKGDIGDVKLVEKLLTDYTIEVVVNFAAESHVDRSIESPEVFFQTNVIGTLRLVDACLNYWKRLGEESQRERFRFLHVSTDEVYGSLTSEGAPFEEVTAFAPNSPYAASKASSDHIVRSYFHTFGLPAVTTNCSNNYGPFQFPEKLIPLMILNALEHRDLPIYGDGMNVRDWLYVEDHCSGIWTAIKTGEIGETYNIGGKNEMTNLQIVDTICAILDEKSPKAGGSYADQKVFVEDRPGHDKRYAINSSKIESELSWFPRETFESGIGKTIQWYLDNQEWCQSIGESTYDRGRIGLIRGRTASDS